MDNLNNIPNAGNWGDAASKLNDNFNKVKQAVTTIENTSKNNKGYFSSLSALNTAFPSPKAGQTAYVYSEASSTKYYIYNAFNGGWVTASVEAPSIGVDIAEYTKTGGSTKTTKEVEDEIVQLADELTARTNKLFLEENRSDITTAVSTVSLNTILFLQKITGTTKKIIIKAAVAGNVTLGSYYIDAATSKYVRRNFHVASLVVGENIITEWGVTDGDYLGIYYNTVSNPGRITYKNGEAGYNTKVIASDYTYSINDFSGDYNNKRYGVTVFTDDDGWLTEDIHRKISYSNENGNYIVPPSSELVTESVSQAVGSLVDGYVAASTGEEFIVVTLNFQTTDARRAIVGGYSHISIAGLPSGSSAGVAFYDSDGVFISGFNRLGDPSPHNEVKNIPIPVGAVTYRPSFSKLATIRTVSFTNVIITASDEIIFVKDGVQKRYTGGIPQGSDAVLNKLTASEINVDVLKMSNTPIWDEESATTIVTGQVYLKLENGNYTLKVKA